MKFEVNQTRSKSFVTGLAKKMQASHNQQLALFAICFTIRRLIFAPLYDNKNKRDGFSNTLFGARW